MAQDFFTGLKIHGLTADTNSLEVGTGNTIAFSVSTDGRILSGGTNLSDIFTGGGTSANLWSASTGLNSIIANNGSGNLASGQYSIVGGSSNYTSGFHTLIGVGYKNSATTNYSSVLNGSNNLANDTYSLVVGGTNNSVNASYGTIVGGGSNLISNDFSFIGNGSANIASGRYSFIGNGLKNSATTSYTNVVGGQQNIASGQYSFIGSGFNNKSIGFQSSILNGSGNTASGIASSILAGTGHTVSGRNSAIIGGGSISGVSDNTVYVPNLVITNEKQIFVATGGTNPSAGLAKLVGGTLTVNTNKVTASSLIFLTNQTSVTGFPAVTTRTPGVSFKITSSDGADTGSVAWFIVEPSLV